jgi:hypothetical protein
LIIKNEVLEQKILELVESRHPSSGLELCELMFSELKLSQKEAVEILFTLEDKNKITFIDVNKPKIHTYKNYLFSFSALWYWIILSATIILYGVTNTSFDNIIIFYIRYLIGVNYIVVLPGYCVLKYLYDIEDFSKIKLFVLSIGISLSFISIQGLILNYFKIINLTSIILFDIIIVSLLSTLTLINNYRLMKKREILDIYTNNIPG